MIRPTEIYTVDTARACLGLAKATIGREIRLGRLRVAKRAGKYFLLGEWLLEWLREGEIRRTRRSEVNKEKVET
jgi:hypothetical protein